MHFHIFANHSKHLTTTHRPSIPQFTSLGFNISCKSYLPKLKTTNETKTWNNHFRSNPESGLTHAILTFVSSMTELYKKKS